MRAVAKDLMVMKVDELKVHAAIVSEYLESGETSREDTPMPEKKLRANLHFYVFTGILCKCTLLHFYGQRAKLLRNPHPMVPVLYARLSRSPACSAWPL